MKYLLTSILFTGEVMFEYNADELLTAFEIRANLAPHQHDYILSNIPLAEGDLLRLKSDTSRIETVTEDLSFENFWTQYNYKVGDKTKARTLWEGLSMKEAKKALNYIRTYESQVAMQSIAKLYPERYIKQKRWNNT